MVDEDDFDNGELASLREGGEFVEQRRKERAFVCTNQIKNVHAHSPSVSHSLDSSLPEGAYYRGFFEICA